MSKSDYNLIFLSLLSWNMNLETSNYFISPSIKLLRRKINCWSGVIGMLAGISMQPKCAVFPPGGAINIKEVFQFVLPWRERNCRNQVTFLFSLHCVQLCKEWITPIMLENYVCLEQGLLLLRCTHANASPIPNQDTHVYTAAAPLEDPGIKFKDVWSVLCLEFVHWQIQVLCTTMSDAELNGLKKACVLLFTLT